MKPIFFFLFFFVAAVQVHAQQVPPPPPPVMADTTVDAGDSINLDKVFISVQIEAKFPGGQQAWVAWLQNNLKANTPVKHKAPPGRYTVIIGFLVSKTGKVSEPTILQDPGYGCAEEVLRLFKKSPEWAPAVLNGTNVYYRQNQSVTFQVD